MNEERNETKLTLITDMSQRQEHCKGKGKKELFVGHFYHPFNAQKQKTRML